jgi:hypothetical protein
VTLNLLHCGLKQYNDYIILLKQNQLTYYEEVIRSFFSHDQLVIIKFDLEKLVLSYFFQA